MTVARLPGIILLVALLYSCEQKDYTISITGTDATTPQDLPTWETATNSLMGIRAFDPVHHKIKIEYSIDSQDEQWRPLLSEKQNLGGLLRNYGTHEGYKGSSPYEKDWGLDLKPLPSFTFLYDRALMNDDIHVENWERHCHQEPDSVIHRIHVEITPQYNTDDKTGFFFQNRWFQPFEACDDNEPRDIEPHVATYGDTVGAYGSFLSDDVDDYHGGRPEIHPAQQIWCKDKPGCVNGHRTFWLFFLQDQSTRFEDAEDFTTTFHPAWYDWGDNYAPNDSIKKYPPYAKSPVFGQWQIAFRVPAIDPFIISTTLLSPPLTMNLTVDLEHEVTTANPPGALPPGYNGNDVDDGFSHSLVIGDRKVVTVNEPQDKDDKLGISFTDIIRQPDGSYTGFVQITMALGDGDDDDSDGAGFLVLHLDIFTPADPGSQIL